MGARMPPERARAVNQGDHYSYAVYADSAMAERFDAMRFSGPIGRLIAETQEEQIAAFLAPLPGRRILDVGTGTGRAAIALAKRGARVTGVDASAEMLEVAARRAAEAGQTVWPPPSGVARHGDEVGQTPWLPPSGVGQHADEPGQRHRDEVGQTAWLPPSGGSIAPDGNAAGVTFVRGDAHALDYPDRSFDAVVCLRVLMHTPDWRASLRELCRVSAGRVVFDYPALTSLAAVQSLARRVAHVVDPSVEAYRVFSASAIARVLRGEGFAIAGEHRQFVLPIALHKRVNSESWTRGVEGMMIRAGLMRVFGSPVTVVAERCAS
jgi:2-polyprenyl-3-methyl-5-hydroxy-6-metoxy-1,4-benzoquinol methylase